MELQSISIVSKHFNISVRTLRYYEQIGLIESEKKGESAYRYYSDDTIKRIQQIIVLRKLRIPLKQIAEMMQNENVTCAIEVFRQNLMEVDDEISALSSIKSILQSFIEKLEINNTYLQLTNDERLLEIIDSLTTSRINFKEDKTMEDLNKANEKLNKLRDRDVRFVHLPPMTIAAYFCKDHDMGDAAEEALKAFSNNLIQQKPDQRRFNLCAHKTNEEGNYGFELWVTIPDDISIPAPLTKKHFQGGLYAAYTINCGMYCEWTLLKDWVQTHNELTIDWSCRIAPKTTAQDWVLEEVLNYNGIITGNHPGEHQVDLLLPIKKIVK